MVRTRRLAQQYRSLGLLLLAVAAVTATIMASCGGGGGSSNGGLCEQCGTTDGPCQSTAMILPGVPGVSQPGPCPTTSGAVCETRNLICRRKSDSAQQRCFPADESGTEVDFSFRCDGSRPGGTLVPATLTPTPLGTATPATQPTKTADPNAFCGNSLIEGLEQCDNLALDGKSCGDFCDSAGGTLVCTACFFNFSLCTGGNCSFSQ